MTDQVTQDAPTLPNHRTAVAGQVERAVMRPVEHGHGCATHYHARATCDCAPRTVAAAAVAAKTQDEDGLMLLKAAVVRAEARREGAVDLDVVVRAIADIEKRRG